MPASQLSVSKGVVSGGGKSVTYGQLLGGKLFNVQMPASYNMPTRDAERLRASPAGSQPGRRRRSRSSQYKLVGTTPPRIDIPAIVTGTSVYIQNVRVPGMLHGRVVRPRGQAVYGFGAPIVSVDESSIKHIPSVRIVRKGDFLGVVAPHEYDAIQAAAQLKVKWADPPAVLAGSGNEFKAMRALDSAGKTSMQTDLDGASTRQRRRGSRLGGARRLAELRLADEHPHPDRPAVRGRRRDAAGRADLHGHPGCLQDAGAWSPRCSGCP